MTVPRPPSWLKPDETAGLLGEWWIVHDTDGNPLRMVWAGGRDTYESLQTEFIEKYGVAPVEFPHTMFNFVDEEPNP